MKISVKLVSVLLSGGAATAAFGQIVPSDLDRSTSWGQLSEAFTNDVEELFTQPSDVFFSSFTFGWDGADPLTGTIVTDPLVANPTGQSYEWEFSFLTENPNFLNSDMAVPVSYIGNESLDMNYFGWNQIGSGIPNGDSSLELYYYQGQNSAGAPLNGNSGPYPQFSQPSNSDILIEGGDASNPVSNLTFWHRDDGFFAYPGTPPDTIADEARFKVFSYTETVVRDRYYNDDTYYILLVDDREEEFIDFDDGIFMLRTTEIGDMVIPEPSALGLGAFMILLGLGVTRRNRKS